MKPVRWYDETAAMAWVLIGVAYALFAFLCLSGKELRELLP